MTKRAFSLAATVLVALLTSGPVFATDGPRDTLDFSSAGRSETFQGLPGVKAPQDAEPAEVFTCTSRISDDDRELRRSWRFYPQVIYSCTDGTVTVESDDMPRSLERQRRGLTW